MAPIHPQPVQLTCPACGTPFRAGVYTLIDVGAQPELKQALLSGQINLAVCPNCGMASMLGAPLIYHDPAKQLCLVYFPQELNARPEEQERFIGEATSFIIRSLPPDAPRAYLLNPRRFLTIASMLDVVLEGDGVSREMIEAQRRRVELISQLADALDDDQRFQELVSQSRADLTPEFMATLQAFIRATPPAQRASQQVLLMLYSRLQETIDLDDEQVLDEEEEAELSELIEHLRQVGDDELEAAVVELRPLIDYTFFQAWTETIEQLEKAGDTAGAALMTARRERILQLVEEMDRQAQAMFEAGTAILQQVLAAADPVAALHERADQVSEALLLAISAGMVAAERTGNQELVAHLEQLADVAAQIIEDRLTPEDRFINQLLAAETPQESTRLLRTNVAMIKPEFVKRLNELADQEEQRANKAVSERLRQMAREAGAMLF